MIIPWLWISETFSMLFCRPCYIWHCYCCICFLVLLLAKQSIYNIYENAKCWCFIGCSKGSDNACWGTYFTTHFNYNIIMCNKHDNSKDSKVTYFCQQEVVKKGLCCSPVKPVWSRRLPGCTCAIESEYTPGHCSTLCSLTALAQQYHLALVHCSKAWWICGSSGVGTQSCFWGKDPLESSKKTKKSS